MFVLFFRKQLEIQSEHKDIDVKGFGQNFMKFDEFTISRLIDELVQVRNIKYKERKNDHLRLMGNL